MSQIHKWHQNQHSCTARCSKGWSFTSWGIGPMFVQKQRLKGLLCLSAEPQISILFIWGSKENWPCIFGAVSTVERAWLLGTLQGEEEYGQPGVFAYIWKELWNSPEFQWFTVKHFLAHHLEFNYKVNRLEFCTRDVIFPLPLISSAIKTCLSALSNDNDKCS